MPQPSIWGRILALAAIVMCTAFALGASAGDTKNPTGFAVVDMQKLGTQFKAKTALEGEFRTMQQKFLARLQRRDTMPFLTEEEHATLDTLNEKATKGEADTAKIKELETKNRTKSEEIQAIQQKKDADLSPADKTKLQEMQDALRKGQQRFTQLKEDLDTQLAQFNNSKSEDLVTKIRASIAKVAEQKGIAVVFSSEVALYAGTDITDTVVGELNKK